MGKIALAILGFVIIFAVVFSLRNGVGAADGMARILVEALAAIAVIVFAISLAPWIDEQGY